MAEAPGPFLSRIVAAPALKPRERAAQVLKHGLVERLSEEDAAALSPFLADDRAAALVAAC